MAKDKFNQKNANAPVTVNVSEFNDMDALKNALEANAAADKVIRDAQAMIEAANATKKANAPVINIPLTNAKQTMRDAINALLTLTGNLDEAKEVAGEFGIGVRGKTACEECGDFRHGKNSTCSKKVKAA